MSILALRPYQLEAVEAIEYGLARGLRRPAVVLPTGAGKTVVFAHLIERRQRARGGARDGRRALVLAHRTELIEQAADKVRSVAPDLSVGIVKAGRNGTLADVVVASVQTLRAEGRRAQLMGVDLVVVDECFPAGTMVGDIPIDQLRPGDSVPSFDEATGRIVRGTVVRVMRRRPTSMVRVTLESGETFACTPGHPLMTRNGWAPAGALRHGASVLSFPHGVRGDVLPLRGSSDSDYETEDRRLATVGPDVLFGCVSGDSEVSRIVYTHVADQSPTRLTSNDRAKPHASRGCAAEDGCDAPRDRPRSEGAWGQWRPGADSATSYGPVSRMADRRLDSTEGWRSAVSLQGRHGASVDDGPGRDRRRVSLLAGAPRVGSTAGRTARWDRVVDVSVLESGRDGTHGGVCRDGFVYNIEVEATHTYLIGNGVVAHNCHHAVARSYLEILTHFGCMAESPGGGRAVAVGFTATMARGDDLALGDVWEDIVYVKPISEMIAGGYLVRPRGIRVRVDDLDLSRVRRVGGDYSEAGLGKALEDSLAPEAIAKAVAEHAPDRPTLLFAPTVASAEIIAESVRSLAGRRVDLVHGKMLAAPRRQALQDFRDGRTDVLANCMVLTEGTDLPMASAVVVARPTTNQALYVQMVGRALRIHPGKDGALVLDVVGASQRHALASPIELFGEDRAELTDDEATERVDDDAELLDDGELTLDSGGVPDLGPEGIDGPLVSEEVDLFHGSSSAWVRTHGGTWVLPAGERYIVLLGGWEAGTFDVVACHRYYVGRSEWVMRGVASLSYAMAWAESVVTAKEKLTASKERPWRKRKPSDAQRNVARAYRLVVDPGETSGELSSRITIAEASARVDPLVPQWARRSSTN